MQTNQWIRSTSIEDLTSHDKEIINKLKYFIEIDKLTKKL
jgi:hypothetical protein